VVTEPMLETLQTGGITVVGPALSAALGAPALSTMNHDDDSLTWQLWVDGELRDQYSTDPDTRAELLGDGDASAAPHAESLAAAFDGDATAVARLLEQDMVFAVEQHAELCRLLGLPDQAAGFGYEYADEGEVPDGVDAMLRVEDGSPIDVEPAQFVQQAAPQPGAPPQFQITQLVDQALDFQRVHGDAHMNPFVPSLGMLVANAGAVIDELLRRLETSDDEYELRMSLAILRQATVDRTRIDAALAALRERLPAGSPLLDELG
jgi:hypothetical protein